MVTYAPVILTRFRYADYGKGFTFSPEGFDDGLSEVAFRGMEDADIQAGPRTVCARYEGGALIGMAGYLRGMPHGELDISGYETIGSRHNLCFIGAAVKEEDGGIAMPRMEDLVAYYLEAVSGIWTVEQNDAPANIPTEYREAEGWGPVPEDSPVSGYCRSAPGSWIVAEADGKVLSQSVVAMTAPDNGGDDVQDEERKPSLLQRILAALGLR